MATMSRSDSYGLRSACVKLGLAALFVCLWVLALTPSLHAADFFCTDKECLIDSINQANSLSGLDTIYLLPSLPGQNRYILTEADNNINGSNGLPVITSEIAIVGIRDSAGRRPSISRAAGPSFRIFYIRAGGKLILADLLINGGFAESPLNDNAARGGAVFVEEVPFPLGNSLEVDAVAFSSNRASLAGGAIFIDGEGCCTSAEVRASTFFDNQALGNQTLDLDGFGGGIYLNNFRPSAMSDQLQLLMNNEFDRNRAVNGNGGGLYVATLDIGEIKAIVDIAPVGRPPLFREEVCRDGVCNHFIFDGSEASSGPDYCTLTPAHCP